VPLIFASSKTRPEIEHLRKELGNTDPFIVENGAAAFIPAGYFPAQPPDTVARDGYWLREWSPPRQRWLDILSQLEAEFGAEFDCFDSAGPKGISRMTGLPPEAARRAGAREYSEPVQWLGSPERENALIARLQAAGAEVLRGGRFLSVSGAVDKGQALAWLREVFRQQRPGVEVFDLAAGDSGNDVAMLEAAGTALLVRSPVHDFPVLARKQGVMYSTDYGPAGWAEGVARWLQRVQEQN